MKKSRMSTLVERAEFARMNIIRLDGAIEYHAAAASKARRDRQWAKQRLERAEASIAKLQAKGASK